MITFQSITNVKCKLLYVFFFLLLLLIISFLDFFFVRRAWGFGWVVQIGLLVIIFVFVTIFGSGFADWGRRRGRHGRKCRPGPTF